MKKDINNATKRALALSKRDQVIESFKQRKSKLLEIAEDGPDNDKDIKLLKMCLHFVIAEVGMSEAEQKDMEKEL